MMAVPSGHEFPLEPTEPAASMRQLSCLKSIAQRHALPMLRGADAQAKDDVRPELAAEAKSIVALAFRNGPIEDVHAGKECPNCAGKVEYSHITQDEMKNIMKRAVDTVYKLLWLKQNDAEKYEATIEFGNRQTRFWDEPKADLG